jgi:hypothetical protein
VYVLPLRVQVEAQVVRRLLEDERRAILEKIDFDVWSFDQSVARLRREKFIMDAEVPSMFAFSSCRRSFTLTVAFVLSWVWHASCPPAHAGEDDRPEAVDVVRGA